MIKVYEINSALRLPERGTICLLIYRLKTGEILDRIYQGCYNVLNKRAEARCGLAPGKIVLKIVPYFTRARALFFLQKCSNKSNYCTNHNYKSE